MWPVKSDRTNPPVFQLQLKGLESRRKDGMLRTEPEVGVESWRILLTGRSLARGARCELIEHLWTAAVLLYSFLEALYLVPMSRPLSALE